MSDGEIRLYVVLRATEPLWNSYRSGDTAGVLKYIADVLPPSQTFPLDKPFRVVDLPSGNPLPPLSEARALTPKTRTRKQSGRTTGRPDELVVALAAGSNAADQVAGVHRYVRSPAAANEFTGSGADLPFAPAEHWCPGSAADPIFSGRTAAERLLGIPALRRAKLTGRDVNVVIVDQGLDKNRLGASYAGGWPVGNEPPGAPRTAPDAPHGGHGMMVARNILSVAPRARLFDLPMLPARINNIQDFFLSRADAAYQLMLDGIQQWKSNNMFPGAWILVNAWAIFDRRTECPPGDYTNNPSHHFHALIEKAAAADIDVVFAAGNCGQFCPDGRCGPKDRGPGSSILGANSYQSVLTVGAVRSDAMWLGYSSQGPGQPLLDQAKPDLCASSQFREDRDAFTVNTGTSTSVALTAGVMAALRGKWNQNRVSPDRLKKILIDTARSTGHGWNGRFGNGILDAAGAYNRLVEEFP